MTVAASPTRRKTLPSQFTNRAKYSWFEGCFRHIQTRRFDLCGIDMGILAGRHLPALERASLSPRVSIWQINLRQELGGTRSDWAGPVAESVLEAITVLLNHPKL